MQPLAMAISATSRVSIAGLLLIRSFNSFVFFTCPPLDNYKFVRVTRAHLDAKLGASLSSVTKMYGSKFAISNLSLDFARNQVSCLLGRNGAGKSTLIKLLTGQTVQTSGQVLLAGEHNVGVCWQDNILIPKLTAREHLELYAQLKLDATASSAAGQQMKPDGNMELVTAEQEVRRTLKSLNFGKHEDYYAYQLSGGYRRRLCVAIAFIGSPSVVILDEPCNGVDAKARKDIWLLIEQLRQGRAVIFATHFLDEAKYLSDALFVMRQVSGGIPDLVRCFQCFYSSLVSPSARVALWRNTVATRCNV